MASATAGTAGVERGEGGAAAAVAAVAAVGGKPGTISEGVFGKGDGSALESRQQQQPGVSLLEGSEGAGASAAAAADPRSLYTIMGLCFLVAIVCALDRVAMSVAIVPMGNVYDYSETTKGLVSARMCEYKSIANMR